MSLSLKDKLANPDVSVKPTPDPKTGEFYCENRKCQRGRGIWTLMWRSCESPECCPPGKQGTHYPICGACGEVMRENVSAPNVIWTGPIGQRYRDKTKDGYHEPDGQWAYTRKTPDGKPKAVRLNDWSQVKQHCRENGLLDPRECGNNIQVAEDGKALLNTCGLPGTEV